MTDNYVRRMALAGGLACVAASPTAAIAKTVELPRTDKWHVDWNEESCTLVGQFGAGKDAIFLKFIQFAPSDQFTLHAFGPVFSAAEPDRGPPVLTVRVMFGSDGAGREVRGLTGRAGKLFFADLGSHRFDEHEKYPDSGKAPAPPMTAEQQARVTDLTIGPLRGRSYRLKTGPMAPPMQAMNACTTDLVRHWGYDPVAQANLSRRVEPIGNPGDWLNGRDYPIAALFNGKSAVVQFRLDVDEQGSVIGCHVVQVTKAADFVEQTCRALTRRARFTPALDAAGKPTKAYYVNMVRWIMGV